MNQPWWCLLHYYSQILGPSCGPGSAWAHAFNSNKPVVRWWHFKEIFIKHQTNHGYLPTSRDTADLTLMFVGFPCGLLAMATTLVWYLFIYIFMIHNNINIRIWIESLCYHWLTLFPANSLNHSCFWIYLQTYSPFNPILNWTPWKVSKGKVHEIWG